MEIIVPFSHIILLNKTLNHLIHIQIFVRSNECSNLAKFIWALVATYENSVSSNSVLKQNS